MIEVVLNLGKQGSFLLLVLLDERDSHVAFTQVFLVEDHAVRAEGLLARLTKVLKLPIVTVPCAFHVLLHLIFRDSVRAFQVPDLHSLGFAQRVPTLRTLALTVEPLIHVFLTCESAAVRAHDGFLHELTANNAAKVVQGDDQVVILQTRGRTGEACGLVNCVFDLGVEGCCRSRF